MIKYHTFAIENINAVIGVFTGKYDTIPTFKLLLPLGISFYTFQSAGYIIDVYRDKYECCNNIFKFALFVSFFPQIMQGPIGRYDRLSPQFNEPHYFSLENTEYGLQLMLWGFFKKIVIADRIGVVADKVFLHPYDYNGIFVIVGVLAYCLQLYADFSGGMDVVSGAAELYGIKLDKNFRQPFFSKSISEFWRRWHITLGTWMKDYVFYPFSLSKKMMKFSKLMKKHFGTFAGKTLPICLADLLIFFLVGVWHGAAWNFVAWGLYYGIILIIEKYILSPVLDKLPSVVRHIYSIVLVVIGWVLFFSPSLGGAARYLGMMFGAGAHGVADRESLYLLTTNLVLWIILIIGSTPLTDVRYQHMLRQKKWNTTLLNGIVYAVLFILCIAYLVTETYNPFLYFRF